MTPLKRIILVVALNDDDRPFILGCYEDWVEETLPLEEIQLYDQWLIDKWYPDADRTMIRHITVDLPEADMMPAFERVEIEGTIVEQPS